MALFKGLIKPRNPAVKATDSVRTLDIASRRRLSFQVGNIQLLGTRERQEDSFAVINAMDVTEIIRSGLFAVVADGMGGMRDGKMVSEAAVAEFVELFRRLDREGDIPQQLKAGIHAANEGLYHRFRGGGGTTAVLALIFDSALYWVSVGDSMIYLKRNGGLFRLNCEHTYQNQLYASELNEETINKQKVESDPDRERLSEFIGIDILGEIDYNKRPLRLKSGDTLLLCSDGISKVLSEAEIASALMLAPAKACEWIGGLIAQKADPRQDNCTGLIIACQE